MPCYVCFDMTFTFMLRRLCSPRLRDATHLKRSRNFRYDRDATFLTGSWTFRHARDVKFLGPCQPSVFLARFCKAAKEVS